MKFKDLMKAKKYAKTQHEGQTRKTGGPYFKHPQRVAQLVKKYKSSHKLKNLMAAAFLHDTIEDTDTTEQDLKKMFGALTASLVQELTSDKESIKEKGKEKYLSDKMINMSNWGLVIKLADRLDNVSDLNTSSKEFRKRYKRQTEEILSKLKKQRKLTNTQKRLIKEIEKKLKEVTDINEEFSDWGNKKLGIYKNPTTKELLEIRKESKSFDISRAVEDELVRFIIDPKKNNVYAFSAHLLHQNAARKLNIPYPSNNYIFDIGIILSNGKIKLSEQIKKQIKKFNVSEKMMEKYFA